jgi:hypothetical protein
LAAFASFGSAALAAASFNAGNENAMPPVATDDIKVLRFIPSPLLIGKRL